jgi:2-keto-3-deoxy-L-rhamnonate aldolase RhmA
VNNAGEIAAVEGIDVLLIGTNDLSTEFGVPGEIGHKLVQDAYEKTGAACRSHGKALGMGGVYDKENAERYIRGGARMVLTGNDHTYLMAGAKARVDLLRQIVTKA